MDAVVKNFPKTAPAAEKPALSDHVRAAPAPAVPRPSREEAEAAVRTLLAYIGDDPGPRGPGRDAEALRLRLRGAVPRLPGMPGRDPRPHLLGDRRLRPAGAGARHSVLFALRASHDAVHRQGAHRLPADRTRRRPVQDRAADRRLCAPPADAGAPDRADRDRDRGNPQAARRRRDARSRAHLHVDARRVEARLDDHHDPVHRPVRRSAGAGALHLAGARAGRADVMRGIAEPHDEADMVAYTFSERGTTAGRRGRPRACAQVRCRRARHLRRDRRRERRRADGRAHERRGARAHHRDAARPGTSAARAARCGARARAPAMCSASPRCASTATRTRCGSRSSRPGRAPATPGGAPASIARCRSARRRTARSRSSFARRSGRSIRRRCTAGRKIELALALRPQAGAVHPPS